MMSMPEEQAQELRVNAACGACDGSSSIKVMLWLHPIRLGDGEFEWRDRYSSGNVSDPIAPCLSGDVASNDCVGGHTNQGGNNSSCPRRASGRRRWHPPARGCAAPDGLRVAPCKGAGTFIVQKQQSCSGRLPPRHRTFEFSKSQKKGRTETCHAATVDPCRWTGRRR